MRETPDNTSLEPFIAGLMVAVWSKTFQLRTHAHNLAHRFDEYPRYLRPRKFYRWNLAVLEHLPDLSPAQDNMLIAAVGTRLT